MYSAGVNLSKSWDNMNRSTNRMRSAARRRVVILLIVIDRLKFSIVVILEMTQVQ